MKVLALIESADHVCYRYRLNALAWALAEEDLFLDALPIPRGLKRIAAIWACKRAEIVILQRKLLPNWQLAILRRHAKRLVYDIDDALFRRDSFTRKQQQSHSRLARFRGVVRAADAVLTGNDYLTQFTSAYADPCRVHFVPTCVEPSWYPLARHRRTGPWTRLAWIGQRSMLPSLKAMEGHLAAVGQRLPDVPLRVICNALPQLSSLRTELRPWSSATEAAELAATDIGISWLSDDLWGQGKCGLKILQYMAAGLPVVANRVGVHRKMIVHGQTGFLADTPEEWAEAVARLADSPALRQRLGAAARRSVEVNYNVRRWGPRVAKLLRQLLETPASRCQPCKGLDGCDTRQPPGEGVDSQDCQPRRFGGVNGNSFL